MPIVSQPHISGFITVEGFPQTLPQRLLQRIQALRRAGREVPALDDRVARRALLTHLRLLGRAGSPSAHREHPLDREQLRVLLLCDHHRARHAPAAPATGDGRARISLESRCLQLQQSMGVTIDPAKPALAKKLYTRMVKSGSGRTELARVYSAIYSAYRRRTRAEDCGRHQQVSLPALWERQGPRQQGCATAASREERSSLPPIWSPAMQ